MDATPAKTPAMGAGHSWEIEYALGNLKSNKVYAWTPDDDKVSETMEAYFANFIKSGNPNGEGLSLWKPMQAVGSQVMVIDVQSQPDGVPDSLLPIWIATPIMQRVDAGIQYIMTINSYGHE